jgi:hypothetical protein
MLIKTLCWKKNRLSCLQSFLCPIYLTHSCQLNLQKHHVISISLLSETFRGSLYFRALVLYLKRGYLLKQIAGFFHPARSSPWLMVPIQPAWRGMWHLHLKMQEMRVWTNILEVPHIQFTPILVAHGWLNQRPRLLFLACAFMCIIHGYRVG